ncbi:hypothetical protein CDAR_403821 [Caerostris darwini]|uniref:Uncharacterized protein n=1 Tax=Caerostris darwini TaxID=1538125 RepID=A0AAV4M571_9ARAC|nr:hypothetical protein CDAR_403821 [Caerostris darwini]
MRNSELNVRPNWNKAPQRPPERIHALTHSRPQRHSPFSKAVLEQCETAESQHLDGEPEIPLSVVKAARAPISERPFDRSD